MCPLAPAKSQDWKPNRRALWLRAICAEVRAGRTLPNGVTAFVPCAWLPRDSLASTCVPDVKVVAASELAKCEAVDEADPAKKSIVDLDVKDWFLDYHECMKATSGT